MGGIKFPEQYTKRYTEHQKKLITPLDRHSLKSTALKLIIYLETEYKSSPYKAHLNENQMIVCVKKEQIAVNSQQIIFKTTETAHWGSSTKGAFSEHSMAIHSISMVGYVTALLGFCLWLTPSPVVEQFLWFLKNNLMRFHCNFVLLDTS